MKRVGLGAVLGMLLLGCGGGSGDACPVLGVPPVGGIIITEIMADPNATLAGGVAVDDAQGEWIELLNALPYTLNPSGMQIASGSKAGRLVCTDTVPPGRFFLVARSADPLSNGGLPKVLCTYDKVTLLNSTSASVPDDPIQAARHNHLQILASNGTIIDDVPYLVSGAGFPKVKKGASMQLCRNGLSSEYNDEGSWWYVSGVADTLDSTDLGTPGAPGQDCGAPDTDGGATVDTISGVDTGGEPPPNPAIGEIFISEFMADPKAVTDADGEWFELYFCGDAEVSLKGMYYQLDAKTPVQIKTDVRMLPGTYAVLARTAAALPAGDPPDALFTGSLSNSGAHSLRILDAGKLTLHEVAYGEVSATGGKVTAGASNHLCISDLAFCPGVTQVWEVSVTAFGAGGDKGTPGFMNESCGGVQ
jgi:hypothetical protein